MNNEQILAKLKALEACDEAIDWVDDRSLVEIWNDCERRDWLFWLLAQCNIERKTLVLIACECARLALPYVREGETRPLATIEIAERWARNDPTSTIEIVREGRTPAAYIASGAYAAAYAASYAAYTAYVDHDDDNDNNDVDDPYLAAYAASEAACDACDNRSKINKKCIEILKKYVSLEDVINGLNQIGDTQ